MATNEPDKGHDRPSADTQPTPTDPAHAGAKAGTFSPGSVANPPSWRLAELDALNDVLARNWWVVALRGVAALLFGLLALFLTWPTIAALILLFAAYMLVDGVFAIVSGVRAAREGERWWPFVLEGIVDLAAGAIAFLAPVATILAFVYLSAAWAIVSGVLMIAAVFRLSVRHGKWLLGLGGIVSVLWGILLFFAPAAGAVVMTWWLGAYALIFGIALLALAFRLKKRHEEPRSTILRPT